VYEDALTILSYASPYDVTMELEKGQQRNNSITRLLSSKQQRIKAASSVSLGAASLSASSSSTAAVALSGSISPDGAPSNERLVHPLYRSQSIDDLSKVRMQQESRVIFCLSWTGYVALEHVRWMRIQVFRICFIFMKRAKEKEKT